MFSVTPDRPDVKIENHGLGQYGAEPHYSTVRYHFGNSVHERVKAYSPASSWSSISMEPRLR